MTKDCTQPLRIGKLVLRLLVLGKIFEGLLPCDRHSVHVTKIPRTNICSPYPMTIHVEFALIRQAVSEDLSKPEEKGSCNWRYVAVGVRLDLSTPTDMTCIGAYVEN